MKDEEFQRLIAFYFFNSIALIYFGFCIMETDFKKQLIFAAIGLIFYFIGLIAYTSLNYRIEKI